MTTGGPAPTTTTVRDMYQAGRVAYQTDGIGTTLATFTYDSKGVPVSVQVGTDPTTAPRYYYVYNGHGDVVALVDASGTPVATYSYDVFGGVTASESLPGGWTNPYRYDGKDRVQYDMETGLYWMSVRAYDATLGRFISRDPLNRQPLVFTDQPYGYAGNNPLRYADPSGQRLIDPDDPTGTVFIPLRRPGLHVDPPSVCDAKCRARIRADNRAGRDDGASSTGSQGSSSTAHTGQNSVHDYTFAVYFVSLTPLLTLARAELWDSRNKAFTSVSVSAGFSIATPFGYIGGFGKMIGVTDPSPDYVDNFLRDWSFSWNISTWIGSSYVTNASGSAIQFEVGTVLFNFTALGASMTGDDPCGGGDQPDLCGLGTSQNYD